MYLYIKIYTLLIENYLPPQGLVSVTTLRQSAP